MIQEFITYAKQKFAVDKRLVFLYIIIYLLWGTAMNNFGAYMEIAKFTYWWQILTVYGVYMIPISLLLRKLPFHTQYAYGLVAMGLLEFGGYLLQSSYAYPDNLMDQYLNIRNFSLGMALFFALYFPLGNAGVAWVYKLIFRKSAD
jgi:hypothetical protein